MSENVKYGQNFSKYKVCLKTNFDNILWVHKFKLISEWQEIVFQSN